LYDISFNIFNSSVKSKSIFLFLRHAKLSLRVVVNALAGLASVAAGPDQLLQKRRRTVFVAQLPVQAL